MAAEAQFRIGIIEGDAGTGVPQGTGHLLLIVADAGDDAHTGDDDTTHNQTLEIVR